MNLKQALKRRLSKKQIELLPRAFDVVGNIAIINLPEELRKKVIIRKVASELLKLKHVKTVVMKEGKVKGRLRKATYKIIGGEKTFETIHKENKTLMKINISKVYFSPRLASDRLDIAKKIKKGELVLVMFAGVLPYALVIAKHAKPEKIYAIEINKSAEKYAKENIKINKINNIVFIRGDVKKVVPSLAKKIKFDRIVMPRPQIKKTFLKEAFLVAKKSCMIHFHDFLAKEEIAKVGERLKEEARKLGKKIRVVSIKKIGEIAPYKYRIRIDFKVLN